MGGRRTWVRNMGLAAQSPPLLCLTSWRPGPATNDLVNVQISQRGSLGLRMSAGLQEVLLPRPGGRA